MTALLAPTDALSAQIQAARSILGHTQAQAATAIGVSLRTWQRLERGAESTRSQRDLISIDLYLRQAGLEIWRPDATKNTAQTSA